MGPLKLLVILLGMITAALPAVTVYPVQSNITAINPDFKVTVDGINVPVQDSYHVCFVHFEMTGTVNVEITVYQPVSYYRLSLESRNITTSLNTNTISFSLEQPEKLILVIGEIDDQLIDGLLIFAEAPEVPPPSPDRC